MKKKITIILIIFLLIINALSFRTYALAETVSGVKDFKDAATGEKPIDTSSLKEVSDILFNTFQILGIIIAAVVIVVLGIQFMTGSIETKAKIKESLIPLIIGIVVLLGAYTIWKIVVDIMQSTT